MAVTAAEVKKLRERTGAGMMDCKKALQQAEGNIDDAIVFLRKKGIADADKRSGRVASEGLVASYIHGEGRIGVLLEVNSETDFVARNDKFQEFVKNIALHIAATQPLYVSEDEVPGALIDKEREIFRDQARETKKPEKVIDKIVEGKLKKFFDQICLLRQPYVKEPDKTVSDLLKELVATIGENCKIRRFARFQLGEGLEKKEDDFVAEVAKQIKQ